MKPIIFKIAKPGHRVGQANIVLFKEQDKHQYQIAFHVPLFFKTTRIVDFGRIKERGRAYWLFNIRYYSGISFFSSIVIDEASAVYEKCKSDFIGKEYFMTHRMEGDKIVTYGTWDG